MRHRADCLNLKYNPKIHRRHSIRLQGYDYSSCGAYFVTICTHEKNHLFGNITNGTMVLNEYGKFVYNEWANTGVIRHNVQLDEFVVMPNHIHGIICIRRGVLQYAPTNEFKSPSQTIGAIVRGFKSTTTKYINQIRNAAAVPVWQRNYYEHIIRDENSMNKIRNYITTNPIQWDSDELNL